MSFVLSVSLKFKFNWICSCIWGELSLIIIFFFNHGPPRFAAFFYMKVYLILDEFILAGELQETSKRVCTFKAPLNYIYLYV